MTDPATRIDPTRIDRLVDELIVAGRLDDGRWAEILRAVPRHLFVPARAYALPGQEDGPPPRVIDRDATSDGWLAAVYSDTAIVTQRDDGATDPTSPDGLVTCSVSAPSVVLPFLQLLALEPGHRVLEIGTGSGWTAALLCALVGDEAVTTVEIDPRLAEQAAANLTVADHTPRLVVGDGAAGWPSGAPYDRVHVTCGVSTIPDAWVRQLRPGGVAVLPWMPAGRLFGFKVKLVANGDGTATGTFHGRAAYMMLRAQRHQPAWHPHHADDALSSASGLDPLTVWRAGPGAELAILAAIPDVSILPQQDVDGDFSLLLAEVDDPRSSWAACDRSPASDKSQVTQYGPRRLWDELESAYHGWIRTGSPGPDQFGITVAADEHTLWLDTPDNVIGYAALAASGSLGHHRGRR